MAQWHGISRRKPSGGRKVRARGKRSTEISTEKQLALIGDSKNDKIAADYNKIDFFGYNNQSLESTSNYIDNFN